jgi:hypothetical protein
MMSRMETEKQRVLLEFKGIVERREALWEEYGIATEAANQVLEKKLEWKEKKKDEKKSLGKVTPGTTEGKKQSDLDLKKVSTKMGRGNRS